jgi:8-oxo-dGTP pyrophosphatase MutT (NUDIX family)
MRHSEAAIALIHRQFGSSVRWLVQWNDAWQAFNFIGGHKRDDESFRECMIRELEEELGLRAGADALVPIAPLLPLEYPAFSERARELTAYIVHLFEVAVVGEQADAAIAGNPANRWLSEPEIIVCRCRDGRPVSETPRRFLSSLGWDWPPTATASET